MTTTTLAYAEICNNVKSMKPADRFTPVEFQYSTGYINDGFFGCLYVAHDPHEVVITFKGTGSCKLASDALMDLSVGGDGIDHRGVDRANHSLKGDLTADLKLLMGVIPNQASTAEQLFKRATEAYPIGTYKYTIAGHSLGGYLAQVVSYWFNVPCVTFNAPGAWGDLQKAKINLFKPEVMWTSIKSTFQKEATCVNFIHTGDVVGNFGLHRGRTVRLAGFSHMMKDVVATIRKSARWAHSSPFEARGGLAGVWDRF
jgi:hypothetical protein